MSASKIAYFAWILGMIVAFDTGNSGKYMLGSLGLAVIISVYTYRKDLGAMLK